VAWGVLGGFQNKTARVELRSGRVDAPAGCRASNASLCAIRTSVKCSSG